jgi:hypothetical protein
MLVIELTISTFSLNFNFIVEFIIFIGLIYLMICSIPWVQKAQSAHGHERFAGRLLSFANQPGDWGNGCA